MGSLGGAGSRTSRVRFISAGVGGDIGVHGRLGGIATVDVGVCEVRGELVNSAGSGSSSHFFSGNDGKKGRVTESQVSKVSVATTAMNI